MPAFVVTIMQIAELSISSMALNHCQYSFCLPMEKGQAELAQYLDSTVYKEQ